ncbi:MAG: glutamate synthase [Pseudomonadota bacterium]
MTGKPNSMIGRILASRKALLTELGIRNAPIRKSAEEGGCGVVGFAASVPVRGRHIFEPSIQMHNRGNGKGGGIAAACLCPEQLGVDADTLKNNYLLQVALIDPQCLGEVEAQCIEPFLDVAHKRVLAPGKDFRDLGLEVKPPDLAQYFVRVKPDALEKFAQEKGFANAPQREVEDEFIYQNSFRLNQHFYSSLGKQRAFVMSHARDLAIFKIVGFAEQVVQYYGLDDFKAQVWIAHQRYPTKGRVWHPAGAHPFIGMNEALVHNGDFANYHGVSEYLKQHGIMPQFLTDTEVSALLFDLLTRVYKYPLECVIEALAPTSELDFDQLSGERQEIYRAVQRLHVAKSPDGPWFFIIAGSRPDQGRYRLLGITDTAMLRPQVFALQEGDVTIGLVGSEKQAIDATLRSLNEEDPRFRLVADRYWNARGGSHTDGGAFCFTVQREDTGCKLTCSDKFGRLITTPEGEYHVHAAEPKAPADGKALLQGDLAKSLAPGQIMPLFEKMVSAVPSWNLGNLKWAVNTVVEAAGAGDDAREGAIELLTQLNDRRFDCGGMRPSAVLEILRTGLDRILDATPSITGGGKGRFVRIDLATADQIRAPRGEEKILVVLARDFEPEGDDCDARLAVKAFHLGWRRFIVYGLKGQRFHGCGFGPGTDGVRMDLYGSSGDYLASGIDGMEIRIHGNAQDQLCQIIKSGRLVVYGDVGQAFMYGAKGGDIYIMGNGAGRPFINAVGRPRVVINGTCLDFLAESFMAGDPHNGGGFVVLNGVRFDDSGKVVPLETPYPGSNLFSLASGGAIFARDPHCQLIDEQLNGGEYVEMSDQDWELILPYLQTNQELFGIDIERDLLTVDGVKKSPKEVYRKVQAKKLAVLAKETVPE